MEDNRTKTESESFSDMCTEDIMRKSSESVSDSDDEIYDAHRMRRRYNFLGNLSEFSIRHIRGIANQWLYPNIQEGCGETTQFVGVRSGHGTFQFIQEGVEGTDSKYKVNMGIV